MSDYKSLCILGRQPALGLAELESLYGAEHVKPAGSAALLDITAEEIEFNRLGGTIKTARVLAKLPAPNWKSASGYLKKNIPAHLKHMPEGKLTLGLSVYGLNVDPQEINKLGLELKKLVKKTGRPCRVVPNKSADLSSAQVLHNKLTHRGGWELLIVAAENEAWLAQTLFVQDIGAYGARDQARPARDARVGMLPPKLAQILINLTTGPLGRNVTRELGLDEAQGNGEKQSETYKEYGERASQPTTQRFAKSNSEASSSAGQQAVASKIRVLDPFCGTGVVLQEALLMNYSVLGTDIEPRMVEYSTKNIQWLFSKFSTLEGQVDIEPADATKFTWPRFSCVVSETYLGRPLNHWPPEAELKQIMSDTNTVLKKFLINLSAQLQPGQKVTLAVPAWRKPGGQTLYLPTIANLTEMGYAYLDLKHVPREQLIYFRDDQVVARQLIRIEKK